ncbi:uncharacterized protein LOC115408071 isoform X2 [Salarias fasciatus]|uniref:Uncharacterized LOC115408071 n=1 Tax=Salarias fasciatus TaxID=181472 RepID=A0A672IV28_SALFA|nr:uncharacterized protein LOC115408071 isoform X2 [Salarias fasciatus]
MRLCAAALLLCAAAAPLLLDGRTCQMASPHGYAVGQCPVNLTSVQSGDSRGVYTVTVRVWMNADDLSNFPKIEIQRETIKPTLKKKKCRRNDRRSRETPVCCHGKVKENDLGLWELKDEIDEVKAGRTLSVRYSARSINCTVSHTVPDFIPDFEVSVNRSSKTINVTVESREKVSVRWCYKSKWNCGGSSSPPKTVVPLESPSVLLSFPYLLSCVCAQVFYTTPDSKRAEKCPFEKDNVMDVGDVWLTSEITQYHNRLEWDFPCLTPHLNISASLCWRQQGRCTPAHNSTLQKSYGPPLNFKTDSVDRHPQMCVQFSLQKSHNIYCPFENDRPTWEATLGPGRRSILVSVTSSAPAEFSAQLCVLSEGGCSPTGPTQSLRMQRNSTEIKINVPFLISAEQLCVQVWQSHPALQGTRILCPDHAHNRRGMYAVAVLVFAVGVALLGIFIRSVVKSEAAGWLRFQRPLLLVSSSDQSAHVSAVCALALILQEELGATVHTSLWAQSSQTHSGAGVLDLGPLPWLYGQWEAVSREQGKVMIIWSPEAKNTFEKWREERASADKDEKKMGNQRKAGEGLEKAGVVGRGDFKPSRKILGKCKNEKTEWWQQKEPSAVIEPVFMASLACLDGALRMCKSQRVSIVYFQGLGHSRDIPKALRGVPRYCLPQDFRGLIQELGGVKTQTKASKLGGHCWPRLLSKVLSIYLARQLARRLRTVLPWTRGPSVSSSVKTASDKTAARLRLPLAAKPETAPEQEPLHGSPEEL